MSRKRNAEQGSSDSTELSQPSEEPKTEIAEVAPELKAVEIEEPSEEPKVAPEPEPAKSEDPLQPVSLELLYGDKANTPPEELTKDKVEASVRKKLSKKTDEEKSDPFVPQAQLDNEVIQVAKEKGFHLSRGTEVGARLIARSRRKD